MMKRFAALLLAALLIPICIAQNSAVVGTWEGKLTLPNVAFRIAFLISQESGALKVLLQSPDQTSQLFPADSASYSGGELKIGFKGLQGSYVGKLSSDGKALEGSWTQSGQAHVLNLKKVEKVSGPNRPQEPKPPFPYKIIEVSFENKAAKARLSGTLTIPAGVSSPPVVVLVTGSGAQDRDEFIAGHRPFWVIADHLSRHGIAVLRYDDRGYAKSTGDRLLATTLDFADDVVAAVEFLKTQKGINPKQIGIIGHSEGGLICPIVATRSKDVAFVISLAGTGVTGEEIVLEQTAKISKASGVPDSKINQNTELQKQIFSVLAEEISDDEAKQKVTELAMKAYDKLSDEEKKLSGTKEAFAAQVVGPAASRWFRTFLTLDPSEFWSNVKVPALILNGEKDLQVLADQNVPKIEKCLKDAGNKRYTVKRFPNLNHLFQTCTTGSPSEYATIEETISPDVLETISDWLLKITK